MKRLRLYLAMSLTFASITNVHAQAVPDAIMKSEPLEDRIEQKRLNFALEPAYFSLQAASKTLTGISIGGALAYALSDHWQVGAGIREAVTMGFIPIFTGFDCSLTYAITGSLILQNRTLSSGGYEVVQSHDYTPGGLRDHLIGTEYLLASSLSVVPLTGVGAALSYELPSKTAWHYLFGVRYDLLVNPPVTATAFQAFLGVIFWF